MLFFITVMTFTRCNDNTETIVEPDINSVNSEIEEEDIYYKEDVFVNGVNQTYLKEMGITEEELLANAEEDSKKANAELIKEIEKQYKSIDSQSTSERGVVFNKKKLADAIAIMLLDIKNNSGKYFQAKLGVASGRGAFFDIGLGDRLIRETIASFPAVKYYRSKTKFNLYGSNLKRIEVSGNSIVKIVIRTKNRFRKYVRFFGRKRRVLNVKFHTNLYIPMNFDIRTNTLKIKKIKSGKPSVKGNFIKRFVIGSIGTILYKLGKLKANVNLDIPFNFISKAYIDYKGVYQEQIKKENFTFFKFNLDNKKLIENLKVKLKKKKIKF